MTADVPPSSQPENTMTTTDANATGNAQNTVAPTSDTASNTANTNQTPDPHSQNTTKSKRRAGRSAVPSWDEILFGD